VIGLFLVGHLAGQGWLPARILAQGRTRAALESLLRAVDLAGLTDTMAFASSHVEAFEQLGITPSNESA